MSGPGDSDHYLEIDEPRRGKAHPPVPVIRFNPQDSDELRALFDLVDAVEFRDWRQVTLRLPQPRSRAEQLQLEVRYQLARRPRWAVEALLGRRRGWTLGRPGGHADPGGVAIAAGELAAAAAVLTFAVRRVAR